ncbi:MAG: CHAT domain-containing protein [Candidatus Aminicenantes bacterium]|nr:CHAT domain-containing protein [Candidatus Aminicenantes bacterium]
MSPKKIFAIALIVLIIPAAANSFNPNSNQQFTLEFAGLTREGDSLFKSGDYEKSRQIYLEALAAQDQFQEADEKLTCLNMLGILSVFLNEYQSAENYFTQALTLAEQRSSIEQKYYSTSIGITGLLSGYEKHSDSGDYKEGEEILNQAISLARDIQNVELEIKCHKYLSTLFFITNDLENYFLHNSEIVNLANYIENKRELFAAYNNIGNYFYKKNQFSSASLNYRLAVEIGRKHLDKKKLVGTLINNAKVYFLFDDLENSSNSLLEALSISEEVKDERVIPSILNSLGLIKLRKGITTKNKEYLNEALSYFNRNRLAAKTNNNPDREIESLNNTGQVLLSLGLYQEAMEKYEHALRHVETIKVEGLQEHISVNIGRVLTRQKKYNDAIKMFERALDYGNKHGDRSLLQNASEGLGRVYDLQKDTHQAIAFYEMALSFIEEIRNSIELDLNKAGYTSYYNDVYERLITLYYKQSVSSRKNEYLDKLFHTIEKRKYAAYLKDQFISGDRSQQERDPDEKKQLLDLTFEKIRSLRSTLENEKFLPEKKENTIKSVIRYEQEYARLLSDEYPKTSELINSSHLDRQLIQDVLIPNGCALIEYFLGEETSYLVLLTKKTFHLFELPESPSIKNSVKVYLKMLSDPAVEPEYIHQLGKKIHSRLFNPITPYLTDETKHLIIVPDGILCYLPFETLISPNRNDLPEYLAFKYSISYLPSASHLIHLINKPQPHVFTKDFVAFGSPDYQIDPHDVGDLTHIQYRQYVRSGHSFYDLPFTGKEIKKICRYFPKGQYECYLNQDANERNVKQLPVNYTKIIHFACHSISDSTNPLTSALIMSLKGNGPDDGFLKTYELHQLELNPLLVVLSACQTGTGVLEKEGFFGLPRAFFLNGAKSVLASLWRVNDKATSVFMDTFYRYLSGGEQIEEALRLTKIKMIKTPYKHPYYWSSFVLNGCFNYSLSN